MAQPDYLSHLKAFLPPAISEDTPHYEAVGRFITSFAASEAAVHVLARKLSGMSDEKARIIFGGMRLADITDRVRQMAKIDRIEASISSEIDACLTQLNLIGGRRHSLVHRTSHYFDGKIVASNAQISKSLNNSEIEFFSKEELAAMHGDCLVIFVRLNRISNPEKAADDTADFIEWTLRPWRYKHAPPKTPNLKSRSTPSKPKRRPPASRGTQD